MLYFNRLELLFLRRLVGEHIDKKLNRIQYYQRSIQSGKDCTERLAVAESELKAMISIRDKLNDNLALIELLGL